MIRVSIGDMEREINAVDEAWINQQINRRRGAGLEVCVKVTISDDEVDLILSTPSCPNQGGGSRPLRGRENHIVELWSKRHLSESDFSGGNLIAFLKQLT